jgi:hypothetical protein
MAKTNLNGINLFSLEYINLYVQILVFAATIYIIYNVSYYITMALASSCNKHCRFLVQEGFDDFSDSKTYFNTLMKRCDAVNKNIGALNSKISEVENNFGTMQKDICYITLQVDEGLQGNYASNVPDDESTYPPEEQKKRAEQRKANSGKYLANLKKTFSESHDNVPLLECFSSEDSNLSDEQNSQLQIMRENLNSKISDVDGNLNGFDNSLINLQKEFSKDILKKYYVTLNYNDKYIKQMVSAAASAGSEGYENDVLDFKPGKSAQSTDDPSKGYEERVAALEAHYQKSVANFKNLGDTLRKYNNTVKQQTAILKQSKKVVNDPDEQKRQMDANSSKVVKAA